MANEPWKGDDDEKLPEGYPILPLLFGARRPPTEAEKLEAEARRSSLLVIGEGRFPFLKRFRRFRPCPKCGSWKSRTCYHPAPDPEGKLDVCGRDPKCWDQVGQHEHFIRQCAYCLHVRWERL